VGVNLEALLAIIGGILITTGVGWAYPPAGLVTAGVLLLGSVIDWKKDGR
jgi:hypothetical protein